MITWIVCSHWFVVAWKHVLTIESHCIALNLMSTNDPNRIWSNWPAQFVRFVFFIYLYRSQLNALQRINKDRSNNRGSVGLSWVESACRPSCSQLFSLRSIEMKWCQFKIRMDKSQEMEFNDRRSYRSHHTHIIYAVPLLRKIDCIRLKSNNHFMHLPIISWYRRPFLCMKRAKFIFIRHQFEWDSL